MSATGAHTHDETSSDLADEVHALQADEIELERRTRSLELAGPVSLVFSVVALALAIGAMVLALGNDSGHMSASAQPGGPVSGMASPMGASGMMTGATGHGRFSSSMMSAASHGTVYVQLGEYWVEPSVRSIRAGKVTFIARNVGQVPHELMVERAPIKFDSPMHPNEDAAEGMIEDMDAGARGRITMRLRPGSYVLFCNLPGHYAAGQHMVFDVKQS